VLGPTATHTFLMHPNMSDALAHHEIPQPRDGYIDLTAVPFERGVGHDGLIHATRKTLNGMSAICGAGQIGTHLTGRFDPSEPSACQDCVSAVNAGAR
jgi:hypothetical protein